MQDPFRRHLVLWLIGREASLTELTVRSGKPMSTMASLVSNLEKLGLLKVAAKVARPGRSIKKYTASAEAFFVPAALCDEPYGSALEAELRTSLQLSAPPLIGTIYWRTGSGEMQITPIREGGKSERQTADGWRIVALTSEQLSQLIAQISNLLDQAEGNQSGARKYLIRFAAAPTAADGFYVG